MSGGVRTAGTGATASEERARTAGAVGIDPRIRARRAEVSRARVRRRRRVVAVVGATVLLLAVALGVLHSSVFAVRHVVVRGERHTSAAAIVDALGPARHEPLVDVNLAQSAARVERLPWVERASVTRRWPDGLLVAVSERSPVAVVSRAVGGIAEVDASGRVLEWAPASTPGQVVLVAPVVPGPPGSDLGASALPGLRVAAALPASLAARVRSVDVGPDATVSLDLGSGLWARLGPAQDLLAKFEALASVLASAPPTGPATIDLTVPDMPVVGPPTPVDELRAAPVAPRPVPASSVGRAGT